MTQIAEKPNLATKIWFDTEFIEDGKTIDLLSIGLVREDGATYYAEPAEADRSRADAWVSEYVLPHLTGPIKPRAVIAAEIVEFAGPNPEFWAYYADYDWVALCQLYGRMIDLPDGWPAFCRDLQQIRAAVGASLPPQKSVEHHALADALWTKEAWEFLCRSSDALITSQAAEIERLREALNKERRRATDAEYFCVAYRNMLGPIGLKVAQMWEEKGVKRIHFSWGPAAAEMTGEERAQLILDWEYAPSREVSFVDNDAALTTGAAHE